MCYRFFSVNKDVCDVGALPIQWPMVEIYALRCHAKICDFMQVIIAVF